MKLFGKKKKNISDVTVFVISCGNNPNFVDCVKALENQDVSFTVDHIRNYAPMSKAFQQMLERCTTKYFVEVDEDMILYPDAIRRLYEEIKISKEETAMFYFYLRDVHLEYNICGVKIYKSNIFKKYPYDFNVISCEMDQLERMKKDGYRVEGSTDIVGMHSPKWTKNLIYERYFDLMQKFKLFGYPWLETLPGKLHKKFMSNPTDQNLFALMGGIDGLRAKQVNEEKNIQIKNKHFLKLKSAISTPDRCTLFITNKCNFKCSFCYRQHQKLEDFQDMTPDIVELLLNRFPLIEGCCICGYGEPLLATTLEDILKTLKKKKKIVGIITNGSLIETRMDVLCEYPPDYISVSLNAVNSIEHEKQCGISNQFDKVIEGIRRVKETYIPLYVSYVCTKENIKDIPEFLELCGEINVDAIYLHNLLPHINITNSNVNDFLRQVLTEQSEIDQIPRSPLIKQYPILVDPKFPLRNCEFPFVTISINGNGSISTCNSIFPPKSCNGNIRDDNVWQNDYCTSMREMFAKKEIPLACKYCFRNYQNWGD